MAISLVALTLALSIQTADVPAKGDVCSLPTPLRDALQQRFGSSRVLKIADLFEDERPLFQKEHPGACPGIARGQFFGPGQRPAIAIVLLDIEPKKNIRLVIARPALSTWTFVEADELDAGTTAVVSRATPEAGSVPKAKTDGKAVNEGVVLTSYETWKRLYSWNGRAFEKTVLTP